MEEKKVQVSGCFSTQMEPFKLFIPLTQNNEQTTSLLLSSFLGDCPLQMKVLWKVLVLEGNF